MGFCIWTLALLSSAMAFSFPPPPQPSPRHSPDPRAPIRIPLMAMKSTPSHGRPFVVVRPISRRQGRRLVLSLPRDNIRILSADAGGTLPLTLSLRDNSGGRHKGGRAQASKFHYGILPMPDNSDEQDWSPRSKGEVVYDMEDLIGSSGGHVTVIKAHAGPKIVKARKVMSGGKSKAMKAIFVEPTRIEAKRVHVMKADVESVLATKGELLGGEPMTVYGSKAKAAPVSLQKGVLTKGKGEDWAASSLHFTKADPPPHEEEGRSMRGDEGHPELHCGGTHDLGWCDLGESYPRAEVSQIMEVCEDLVSRMYVEVPEDADDMEDIASYSLSRNISGGKPTWHRQWRSEAPDMKRSLCDVKRNVIRPSFAQDVTGKWHVIIQTDAFPQRIALEVCKKPGEGCSHLCSSSQSQCVQRYSHQQLISFDPESAETCPYVRLYKFPTSCVCRIANKHE